MQPNTTVSGLYGFTSNTTHVARTTTSTTSPPPGLLSTADGRVILAFLVLIFLILVATPILTYILGKRFCWVRVHDPERGKWETGDVDPKGKEKDIENEKSTQTDVLGLEFDEFFKRRRPIDMSKYHGKPMGDVEEPYPRWFRINPNEWTDPWSMRHAGKETNYMTKEW